MIFDFSSDDIKVRTPGGGNNSKTFTSVKGEEDLKLVAVKAAQICNGLFCS